MSDNTSPSTSPSPMPESKEAKTSTQPEKTGLEASIWAYCPSPRPTSKSKKTIVTSLSPLTSASYKKPFYTSKKSTRIRNPASAQRTPSPSIQRQTNEIPVVPESGKQKVGMESIWLPALKEAHEAELEQDIW